MVMAADYPFRDILGTMFVFFGFVIWFWLLTMVFGDLLRRNDIGGWAKCFWSVFVLVVPLLGVLIYLIATGGRAARATAMRPELRGRSPTPDVRETAGNGGPGNEIGAGEATARQRLVLIYLIATGRKSGARDSDEAGAQRAESDTYVRETAGNGGPGNEIAQAKQLLDNGSIDQAEFNAIKQKALA